MSRRRLVAIASASMLLLIGVLVVGAVLAITQTDLGRGYVRNLAMRSLASSMGKRGTMYIGQLEGGLLTGITIDSFAIRDAEDSVFVATGPIHLRYDPRDVFDRRIRLSTLEITRPVVNLRRHADKEWNFQRIFPSGPKKPRTPELRFGDYIVADSVILRDATILVTEPWDPPDSLRGARRDSAVRAALASPAHDIRRTSEGLKQTRRFSHVNLEAPFISIADPDRPGRYVQVGRLDVAINDPPFIVSRATGPVRILGDSVWLELRHFELPGSAGRATGKVWWGNDLPTRYDVQVATDSVSLADIAWVYPTLPTAGGGRLDLRITNEPRDLHVIDYALAKMDVHTGKTRLRGAMTFGVGGPVLIVKDLSLQADPLDFDFLRALNGKPFPTDWQGQFFGTVRGPGGPVNRLQLGDVQLTFHDGHVPGAVSKLAAHGGLDIVEPSLAVFRGLDVDITTLDLRTPRFLFPNFPRLQGTISGVATLDSVWTDLRFSDADVYHHDGPGLATHVTGSGRVTYGDTLSFDVTLNAAPLAFTTLARSYPALRLRGPYTGPVRVKGTMGNLELETTLTGGAGEMAVSGTFDFLEPGYAGRGSLSVRGLDVARLLEDPKLPPARVTARIAGDVRGDSLADLQGTLTATLDSSLVSGIAISRSDATLGFGGGIVRVDSLLLHTVGGTLAAHGALGLAAGARDTLHYTLTVDSLGGLRRLLRAAPPRDTTRARIAQAAMTGGGSGSAPPGNGDANSQDGASLSAAPSASAGTDSASASRDSLAGTIRSEGVLIGSIDTLEARGAFSGDGLYASGLHAQTIAGNFAFHGLPRSPAGSLSGVVDTMLVAGVRLDSVSLSLGLADRSSGSVALQLVSGSLLGAYRAATAAHFARVADTLRVTVDSASLLANGRAWQLERPAMVRLDSAGTSLDSLTLRNGEGGVVMVNGTVPLHAPVNGELVADSVPLADLGTVLQLTRPLSGFASMRARVSGMRATPSLRLDGTFDSLTYGDLHFPYFTVAGTYADRRLQAELEVLRKGAVVLTATGTLPMNLALESVPERLIEEPLTGSIEADSVDLAILEAISSQFANVSGRASTHLTLGGTWRHPMILGAFGIQHGVMGLPKLGIQLRDLDADVSFSRDSVRIARFTAASGTQRGSAASLHGSISVPDWRDPKSVGFDVSMNARNFLALDRRSVARVEFSGGVRLGGTLGRPVIQGDITVDRGALYASDIFRKQVVNLNDPEAFTLVDTTLEENRGLLETSPFLDSLVTHLRVPSFTVRIGDDVWLRSEEANIKLAGSMELSKTGTQRVESGTLRVSRGTYRLDFSIVQRTFQVDSGTVTFYGDPHIQPELNVWASYTVRQANRQIGQDVRIIAHIAGTLRDPRLELSSDERFPLSQTEILSYLVFGQPSIAGTGDLTANPALQQVAAALLPSVGAVLERALADQIGFIDYVQVQTGTPGQQSVFSGTGAQSFLSGTRIGVGKQIGERTFVTANAGLCSLTGAQTGISFGQSLGLTVEHRLGDGFTVQGSIEPSSAALQCRPGLTTIGSRPPQYGFDLFREWSF